MDGLPPDHRSLPLPAHWPDHTIHAPFWYRDLLQPSGCREGMTAFTIGMEPLLGSLCLR
jgi:hypothetical protein